MFFDLYGQPEGCQREECDFYVEWRINGVMDHIDFRMEGNADGWIAMGITTSSVISGPGNVSSTVLLWLIVCGG